MRAPKRLLTVVVALLAWKAIRTDWVVVAPYWFGDPTKTTPPGVFTTYDYRPPISPVWHRPKPGELDPTAKNWEPFFPGGGAWGITGEPRLRPNWMLIGVKLFGAFLVLYPTVVLSSYIVRRISRATAATPVPNDRNA